MDSCAPFSSCSSKLPTAQNSFVNRLTFLSASTTCSCIRGVISDHCRLGVCTPQRFVAELNTSHTTHCPCSRTAACYVARKRGQEVFETKFQRRGLHIVRLLIMLFPLNSWCFPCLRSRYIPPQLSLSNKLLLYKTILKPI
jgi:hypothetical protein